MLSKQYNGSARASSFIIEIHVYLFFTQSPFTKRQLKNTCFCERKSRGSIVDHVSV